VENKNHFTLNRELIINSTPTGVEIALLEDKKLVQLNQEKSSNNYVVGDIFLGRIKKLIPGLNAAFIDVGYHRDAFLHYTDLGSQIKSMLKYTQEGVNGTSSSHLLANFHIEKSIVKTGKIAEVLNKKNVAIANLQKQLALSRVDNSKIFPEVKILFPEIKTISIAKHQFNEGTDSTKTVYVMLYKTGKDLDKVEKERLTSWLKQKLQVKDFEIYGEIIRQPKMKRK